MQRRHRIAALVVLAVGPALAVSIDALIGDHIDSFFSEARHRTAVRQHRAPVPVPAPLRVEQNTVRVIPLVRWKLWCERVGGFECPKDRY
jgi:hypothetical protein